MTDLARFRRRDVRRTFADSHRAIVAVLANIRGLAVIQWYDIGVPARAGGVTGLTDIGGHWMGWRLISSVGASMTAGTRIGGLAVIKRQHESKPTGIQGVAEIAAIRC